MCDVAVIGAGVIGLAIAREVLIRAPGLRVVVFDKEPKAAAHASGRNSGVLHAGFYYSPDSLKAQLTRRGNDMLRAFCLEHEIPVNECGKVVVTQRESELDALDELARRAEANDVDVDVISTKELAVREPLARTVDRALWSPRTAVASPGRVGDALAADVRTRGGLTVFDAAVTWDGPGRLTAAGRRWSASHVVNAAGLHADRLAHSQGFGERYRVLPFKGLYLYGNWPVGRLTRLVYPVPDPRNPFLGVHLTLTVDGRVKLGPTAVPALWREQYGWRNPVAADALEISRTMPLFLRSPHHDVASLLRTELPKYSRRVLAKEASRLVPAVSPRDFRERGRPGIRAQLFDLEERRLVMDFVVEGDARSTHVLNAVSPAWTSSLAFAELVVDRIPEVARI